MWFFFFKCMYTKCFVTQYSLFCQNHRDGLGKAGVAPFLNIYTWINPHSFAFYFFLTWAVSQFSSLFCYSFLCSPSPFIFLTDGTKPASRFWTGVHIFIEYAFNCHSQWAQTSGLPDPSWFYLSLSVRLPAPSTSLLQLLELSVDERWND